jgi:hypothetical protein
MTLEERIDSFVKLGKLFIKFPDGTGDPQLEKLREAATQAQLENPWFTQDNICQELVSLSECLTMENLNKWLKPYSGKIAQMDHPVKVAVVMAGNIPLVGFHDFLSVLITGHRLIAKLSSKDAVLLPAVIEVLTSIHPEWKNYINTTRQPLRSFDAIIATGSDNASRYFEYYFGKYPNIIRKNRNSIAVITGEETSEDLMGLADDIMLYFGLGCRSVSKIYIPYGWDLKPLISGFGKFENYRFHNKYMNNYDYFKSIYIVNQTPFIDTGYIILTENNSISSPVSVLFYEYYNDITSLSSQIDEMDSHLQCIVCRKQLRPHWNLPGTAQHPALWDYADRIDTIRFLLDIGKKSG